MAVYIFPLKFSLSVQCNVPAIMTVLLHCSFHQVPALPCSSLHFYTPIQVIPIQNLTHNVTFPLPLPYPVKYPVHSRIPFTFRAQFSLFSFPSCTKASYLFSFSLKIFKTSATMIFIRSVLSRNNNFSFRRIPYNLACVSHVFPSIYIYYT